MVGEGWFRSRENEPQSAAMLKQLLEGIFVIEGDAQVFALTFSAGSVVKSA